MLQRVEQLRTLLCVEGIDALLITKPENRRYVSGFTGTSAYIVVSQSDAVLLTDFRYVQQASEQATGFRVVEHKVLTDTLAEQLKQMGIKKLGFEKHVLTFETFTNYQSKLSDVELVACGPLVESLRCVKDEQELGVIQQAAIMADSAFEHITKWMRPGISEKDVALELEFFMRKLGASSTSFETIVASGKRSSLPHGVASDKLLEIGDFVTLDFGAFFNGYCSDLTRTVCLGRASDEQKKLYDVVLRAQLAALDGIRPGMTGKEADAIARGVISDAGFAEQFGHGLGHGIGLEIHEGPRLSTNDDTALAPGMVVTVEPGVYIPFVGGVRIEDDIVITDSGCRVLTSSPKELLIIG